MLVPRPDISTPTLIRSAMMGRRPGGATAPAAGRAAPRAASPAGLDPADFEDAFSSAFKRLRHVFDILPGDDQGHADPAIEGPRHFLRLDIALRLEEGHQPRLRPAIGVDRSVEALG